MAKKKSKTQKLKKNLKTKTKRVQQKILEQTRELKEIRESAATPAQETINKPKTPVKSQEKGTKKLVEKEKVKYNIAINKKNNKKSPKQKIEDKKQEKKKDFKKSGAVTANKTAKKPPIKNYKKGTKKLVEKDKVEYNITLQESKDVKKEEEKVEIKNEIVKEVKPESKKTEENKFKLIFTALLTSILVFFKNVGTNIKMALSTHKKNKAQRQAKRELISQINAQDTKEIIIEPENEDELTYEEKEKLKRAKQEKRKQEISKKSFFVRLMYGIFTNRHIFFNAILIVFFLMLLIGLNRIDVITKGTIFYISLISIFLMAVAISYNKYLSGKIFTILLCALMGFAIYRINYTYDFIRSLNTAIYEYKTYYVVTFNSTQNKSIFNINNKKVGLYKDNTNNIERKLNTKLDKVNYIEYDDLNELFEDFYNQKFRAILVNENQYKYMKNLISENARDVKILYEFKANAKK